MATRIDELEHEGDVGPKPKPVKVEEDYDGPEFADQHGVCFRDMSGDPDDSDDLDMKEPKGFDPIKSRYIEEKPLSTTRRKGKR